MQRYLTLMFCLGCALLLANAAIAQNKSIITVMGKVNASKLNRALIHEHVTTNFIGADSVTVPSIVDNSFLELLFPRLENLKEQKVNFMFECTPAYIGRDVRLLKSLSERSGIHFVTNTGWYAAVDKKYLPKMELHKRVDEIAAIWEREFFEGIEGTGIRPGFIKLGVGTGTLDSIEAKLLLAAILVSKKTQLQIAVHTGDFEAAWSEFEIIKSQNYPASNLVWVHAQNGTDDQRKKLAEKGVFVSMDNVNEKNFENYAESILFFKKHNLLNRLLISHDDGWSVLKNGSYRQMELFDNGNSKAYQTIFSQLVPLLLKRGLSLEDVDQLLRKNPIDCFSIEEVSSSEK